MSEVVQVTSAIRAAGAAPRAARRARILECEIADGVPSVPARGDDGTRYDAASILVRIFTEPVALLLLELGPEGLPASRLAGEIDAACGDVVRARIEAAGIPWTGAMPTGGLEPARQPPYLASREAVLRSAPDVTVAICTRNRSDLCRRMLDSLVGQAHRPAHVVIVDNAPTGDAVAGLAEEYGDALSLSYVVEPRPGLSWARNCAIAHSDTEVIAWLDDDEVCDRWWLAELSRGFVEHPEADAVSGAILPAELDAEAQWIFEAYGGHRTQRAFQSGVFSPATRRQQSPLYPLPPFGAGGNMAFRRESIERIGRFDCALGAGTLSMGAEDTAAFSLVLYRGGTVVYQPSAFVYHYHHRDYGSLERVFTGYGRGLTAFYTSVLVRHPLAVVPIVRLVPRALRDLFSGEGARLGKVEGEFPRELIRANLRGMVQGPLMYARARVRARRLRRGAAPRARRLRRKAPPP